MLCLIGFNTAKVTPSQNVRERLISFSVLNMTSLIFPDWSGPWDDLD